MSLKKHLEGKKEIKEIVKKLASENRYFEISTEYEDELSLKEVANFESMMETGKKFNNFSFKVRDFFVYSDFKRKRYKLKKGTLRALQRVGELLVGTFIISIVRANIPQLADKELVTATTLAQEYDANLDEYVKQFNTDTMSTMEIVMTVMNDIRSNTYYGLPENEILNFPRLSLDENNNVGTCRNMADKFTTIMNLIDPRFEAKNFAVTLDPSITRNEFTFCNIETPIEKEFLEKYQSGNSPLPEVPKFLYDVVANHLVTILKPIEDDYYLVVDVTNPSLGILKNGKVYTFNADQHKVIYYRPFSQVLTWTEAFDDINRDLVLSMFQDVDLEEAEDKYGLDAQNKVLKKIKD